ncbi:hypothetical protein ABZ723_15675 [Streptomyces sp. NPDC006700]|uniref:hypothetical protein n=1 Tax=Streptomyces sp. NPDC006700 TaxID=3154479 RepID=UPI0033C95F13
MIIPIRVPVDAAIHTDGGIRQLGPEHPLFRVLCPACGSHLEDQPITLVYVGAHPEDRKASGWMTGAAVGVHAACVGVPTTPVDDPRCVCGGPIEWWTGPNESAGWIHSPSSETPILDVHRPRPRATASAAGEDPCLPRMSSPTQPSPARARFIEVLRSRGMLRPGEEWVIDVNLRAYANELAEQAQAAVQPPMDRAAFRQCITEETALGLGRELLRDGLDSFLRRLVGPENAQRILAEQRAAVLREAADRLDRKAATLTEGAEDLAAFVAKAQLAEAKVLRREAAELRRMADETQQPTASEESPTDAARRFARRLAAVERLCSGRPGYHTITVKALLTAMGEADDEVQQS